MKFLSLLSISFTFSAGMLMLLHTPSPVVAFLTPTTASSVTNSHKLSLPSTSASTSSPSLTRVSAESENNAINTVTIEKTGPDSLHTIKGSLNAKELKTVFVEAQKDIAKRQTYPGFRPGVIPPFALKPIKDFAIRMTIEEAVQRGLQEQKMELLDPAQDGNPGIEILEPKDIETLVEKYNFEYDLPYTATAQVTAKEQAIENEDVEDTQTEEDIIDVQAK